MTKFLIEFYETTFSYYFYIKNRYSIILIFDWKDLMNFVSKMWNSLWSKYINCNLDKLESLCNVMTHEDNNR